MSVGEAYFLGLVLGLLLGIIVNRRQERVKRKKEEEANKIGT